MPQRLSYLRLAEINHAQLYEILVGELTGFVVFLIDLDGCIASWNPGVERVLGYTEQEWIGEPVARIFTTEDQAQSVPQEEISHAAETGRASDVRWHVRKDGERLFVEGAMVALRNESGELLGFSKVMRDITDRHRREQQNKFLARLEDALRPLIDPTEMMQVAVKLLGEHLRADRCTYSHVASDGEQVDVLSDYTRPGVASIKGRYKLSQFGTAVAQRLRSNRPVVVTETRLDASLADVKSTYEQLSIHSHASVPLRKAGKLAAIMAVHQGTPKEWMPFEIELIQLVADRCWESLERARLTQALRESETRHRTLFNSIDEGYCIIEVLFNDNGTAHDYRFVDINGSFEKHTGFVNAIGKTMREFVPNHEQHWYETYGNVVKTGEPTRFVEHADAMGRWFDVYAFRLGQPENHQVAVLFRDITAKKEADAERELLHQQISTERQRLRQVFLQAPVAVVVFRGKDFIVELANPFYQALLSGRELVGRRFADVLPELGADVWKVLHRVFETGESFVANDWKIPYDFDQDGVLEDHWFNVAYTALREADGSTSGVTAVCTEVTTQVRSRQELERTNRELSRVNRSLEEFSYAASHDLQEPLRMVNAYSELLIRNLGKNPEQLKEYAGFVSQGVQRMQELIRDLLTFASSVYANEALIGTADLSLALSEALSMLSESIKESGATVQAGSLPITPGDTKQLTHVFQNLIANALKYRSMSVAPEIIIEAVRRVDDWIISIRDNGIGFKPEYADQIFGLFKRLHKDDYPGTGVGLAICQRIVERFGGRMWAEGEPERGATFYFSLPAAVEGLALP